MNMIKLICIKLELSKQLSHAVTALITSWKEDFNRVILRFMSALRVSAKLMPIRNTGFSSTCHRTAQKGQSGSGGQTIGIAWFNW